MDLMTGYKKFLTQKEIKIKMSLLNVPNVSNKSEEFSLKDIEVLVGSGEQNWFKRVHAGKYLGLKDIEPSTRGLDKRETCARHYIKAAPHARGGGRGEGVGWLFKEQETILNIMTAFKGKKMCT